MPNWTQNHMNIRGKSREIQRFISAITTTDDEGNTILRIVQLMPMPEALEGTESPTPASPEPNENWARLLAEGEITQEWHDELVANQIRRYEAGQKAKAETGYYNWWDWQIKNWGTKWGDSQTEDIGFSLSNNPEEVDSANIQYQTPWSPLSESFFSHVSSLFPTLRFEIQYEEESGEYVGVMVAMNGKVADKAVDFHSLVHAELPEPDYDDADSFSEWHEKRLDFSTEVRDKLSDSLAELIPYPV